MRSDMKRHMQMHARDGSDVSLLLACAEQGIDPLEAITADPDALAALREKTANSSEVKTVAPRANRGRKVYSLFVAMFFILNCIKTFLFHLSN